MKIKNVALLFILSLFIPGHGQAAETGDVVVTIKPLHSLVSGVMGDTGSARLLVTGNASPHDFQLKPSQVKAMSHASAIFYIDDSFETFLHGVFETLPKSVRRSAMAKKAGLTVLFHRKGGAWDAHDHDGHDEHGHKEEHHHDGHDEHGHKEEHHHDAHDDHHDKYDDMHVWLDPENARKIVKFIVRELSEVYPENRDAYKANAQEYIKKINALDVELKTSLKGLQNKAFVVFHDAYQYFERAYSLSGVGSITFIPGVSPPPSRIREVREKLRQTGAKCVFREPQFSDRLVNTVAEGTNARGGTLDPLGADLAAGEELYFSLMRNLASNLKQCLKQ
jgi:zinc transport system substrate-binding protein